MIETTAGLAVIALFFVWVGHTGDSIITKFGAFGIALIEIIIIAGVTYGMSASINITRVLQVNFYSLMVMGVPLGAVALYKFSLGLLNPEEDQQDSKWSGKSKW